METKESPVREDAYLSLAESVVLHLTPRGARITSHNLPLSKSNYHPQTVPVATVNEAGREFLLLCDGKHTLREIVSLFLEQSKDSEKDSVVKGRSYAVAARVMVGWAR